MASSPRTAPSAGDPALASSSSPSGFLVFLYASWKAVTLSTDTWASISLRLDSSQVPILAMSSSVISPRAIACA